MPSLLCAIVVLPLARVLVVLVLIPTVFVPLYLVPFTVTLHFFEALELIEAYLSVISCKFQFTVEVLFASETLARLQLNFKVKCVAGVILLFPLVAILLSHPFNCQSKSTLFCRIYNLQNGCCFRL